MRHAVTAFSRLTDMDTREKSYSLIPRFQVFSVFKFLLHKSPRSPWLSLTGHLLNISLRMQAREQRSQPVLTVGCCRVGFRAAPSCLVLTGPVPPAGWGWQRRAKLATSARVQQAVSASHKAMRCEPHASPGNISEMLPPSSGREGLLQTLFSIPISVSLVIRFAFWA